MTIDIIINRPSRRTRTRACVDRTVWRNYVYRVYNLTYNNPRKSPQKIACRHCNWDCVVVVLLRMQPSAFLDMGIYLEMRECIKRHKAYNKHDTGSARAGARAIRIVYHSTPPSSLTASGGRLVAGAPAGVRSFRGWLIPRVPYSGLVPSWEQTAVPATRHKDARLESLKSHRATQTQHAPYKAARVRSAGYSSQYDLEPRVPLRNYVSAPRRLAEDSLVHPRRTAALAHHCARISSNRAAVCAWLKGVAPSPSRGARSSSCPFSMGTYFR